MNKELNKAILNKRNSIWITRKVKRKFLKEAAEGGGDVKYNQSFGKL